MPTVSYLCRLGFAVLIFTLVLLALPLSLAMSAETIACTALCPLYQAA
jgi:hypothetical protein